MNLEELRARLGAPAPPPSLVDPSTGGPGIERCVPGHVVETEKGPSFVVDSVRGFSQSHGRYRFDELDGARLDRVRAFARDTDGVRIDIGATAFIDTETTGLGYGVGTQVFMVGVGHRDGDAFRVRQFFLRHPGEEPAMLTGLAEYLRPFSTVVSFNGRSFDWPLLENRFIYRRVGLQPASPAHLDLLHLARRLWRLRLDTCGLASIERSVLGVSRTGDDVEGWVIPQLYFRYMRTGNARPLRRVFYHNLQDVLSLAFLMVHIDRLLQDPWSGMVQHPVDFFSLGRVYQWSGDDDMAVSCYRHALEHGLPGILEPAALLRLAVIEKRRRNWDSAIHLLHRVVECPGFELIGCVELAKYHEHVARDHEKAMSLTVRALRASDRPTVTSWPGVRRIELQHRHRRLVRRLSGASV